MIYLDNSSTTSPKPEEVCIAVEKYMRNNFGSPGRSVNTSNKEKDVVLETRELIGKLIHMEDPYRIVFTCSATDSLNLALKGYLKKGDHVIITSLEHNSVLRPLKYMEIEGLIEVSVIYADKFGYVNPDEIQAEIKSNTKLIATTHASNVIGTIVDIETIGQIAALNDVKYLVDASQSIGAIEIDVNQNHVDLLAIPGHKNLFGPAGIGALYIKEGINLAPFRHGGTGTASESLMQPELMPHKYESGTANLIGIAGLNAGIKFIFSVGMEKIRKHEEELSDYMYKELLNISGVTIYGTDKAYDKTSVISLNIKNEKASVIGQKLLDEFNIMTRAGLHCAPLTHKTIGTESRGTVRFGIGYFNTKEDIDASLEAIDTLCKRL
ncbi:MAG: aminotransferase class V-fold PLP-dependent enzyme [Smithella sp.]